MSAPPAEPERDLFGRAAPDGTWAHRRGEPRLFALGWTALLLVATGAALMASGMGWVFSEESFRANAQRLMLVVAVLTTIVWPMVRLSQAKPACGGVRACLRDLIIVLVPMQAVIWPQALPPAAWPAPVAGAVALYLGAWATMIGGLLALAMGPGRAGATQRDEAHADEDLGGRSRVMWMGVVLLVAMGGVAPALLDLGGGDRSGGARTAWLLSPQTGVFELTRDRSWTGQLVAVSGAHWRAIVWVGVVALGVWTVACLRSMVGRAPEA